jgi:outer membrane lipoprotein-sorting protein
MTKITLAALLALLLTVPGQAKADDWASLRRDTSKIRTISADFVQQKELKILRRPLVSRGRFLFSAPDSVRWEYQTPVQVVSLVKGGDLKRFTHTADQGWVLDSSGSVEAMRIVMNRITGWLSGDFHKDEAFDAELRPGPPIMVVLTPKDAGMERLIRRVELVFSSSPGVVESVRIHEGPDTRTTITFEDVKLDQEISPARFEEVK